MEDHSGLLPIKTVENILNEREKTHGDFALNAEIAQHLRAFFRVYGFDGFTPVEREALDMIALKLSRVLSGQSGCKDHWVDIAGYATLVANRL